MKLLTDSVGVTTANNVITVTGSLQKKEDWTEAFIAPEDLTGYYLPIILEGEKDNIVEMTSLSGEKKTHVFGQTGDTDTTMVLVLAIDPVDKTREFTAFNADKSNSTNYTIDCTSCEFKTV